MCLVLSEPRGGGWSDHVSAVLVPFLLFSTDCEFLEGRTLNQNLPGTVAAYPPAMGQSVKVLRGCVETWPPWPLLSPLEGKWEGPPPSATEWDW